MLGFAVLGKVVMGPEAEGQFEEKLMQYAGTDPSASLRTPGK
jgi:hypothetical protein